MLQLRIKHHPLTEGRHRVDLDLTGDGAPRAATSTFAFGLSPQDEEDLRWYLEDFLQYPQEPAPAIAQRIEGRMFEVGTELFQSVFQANDDARRIWSRVEERLTETRIEIVSGVTEAATIPWELLREPSTTSALALTAQHGPRPPASRQRQWFEAERLQTACAEWDRRRTAPALARPAEELENGERHAIGLLAVTLGELGHIRREMGRTDCVPTLEEALELSNRIGERAGAATCAFNLGCAFEDLPALRDLDQAERWYRRSMELRHERDRLGSGRCAVHLGGVTFGRFCEAIGAERPEKEIFWHFHEAVRLYHAALALFPMDAVNDLAVAYNALGAIYSHAGDLDCAAQHYRESIQLSEKAGDLYRAAVTRFNVAFALSRADCREDALEYAEAALRGFESYGEGAEEEIEKTRGLIAAISGP